MAETINYGHSKGWKQVIFGHIGRDPKGSLKRSETGWPRSFIVAWSSSKTGSIRRRSRSRITLGKGFGHALPGSIVLLENTRKYPIETVLWKAKPDGIPNLAPQLAKLANEFSEKVAKVYVNEAFSAGSLDSSTTVVPAGMDRVALGDYVAGEFEGPLMDCLNAQLVVSSGLKIDKLDDLEAMINRGKIRLVFTAGSLAVGLKKAAAELDGQQFSIGVAEDPAHSDKPYYIPRDRVEQAKKMISEGRGKGIEFVMPVDFVLQDGRVSAAVGPGDQQLDVGPTSNELFAKKVGQFIDSTAGRKRPRCVP